MAWDAVFHEKQEGSLCAVHCLNALLQGSYFTPVDLGTIAKELDEAENQLQDVGQAQSTNMDDSGYFSVQVISKALEVWGLEMVPLGSSDSRAIDALRNPAAEQAYICNYRNHWFTVRRIQQTWYNLNSVLSGPQPISDTFLSLFLMQLKNEGYSIFAVFGDLPQGVLDLTPPSQTTMLAPLGDNDAEAQKQASQQQPKEHIIKVELAEEAIADDPDLARAIELSLTCHQSSCDDLSDDDEKKLQSAIKLSLEMENEQECMPKPLSGPFDCGSSSQNGTGDFSTIQERNLKS